MNKFIGDLLIGAFWVTVGAVVDGFLFYKFYEWFVKTSFNLPDVEFINMVGIALLFGYMGVTISDSIAVVGSDKKTMMVAKWTMRILAVTVLAIGYIVHLVDMSL